MYESFLQDTDYPHCWACGRDERQRPDDWYAPWFIQRAHLGSGGGTMRRVEDRRCVNLLCPRCHLLHGGDTIKVGGKKLPPLTNENMLFLKLVFDPEFYDREYLEGLWVRLLPEPEIPDPWYRDEYTSRRNGSALEMGVALLAA